MKQTQRDALSARTVDAFAKRVLADPAGHHPVKVARATLGITANELADLAAVTSRTVFRAEAGGSLSRASRLRIAGALGGAPEDYFR